MNNRILIVDDEYQILKAFKRTFIDTSYEVVDALGAKEALKILESDSKFDVVVSDMRMPEMDGYKFLSQVKKEYPHIVRIILSGFTDDKTVIKSIHNNTSRIYIFKPWDNAELILKIEQIMKTEDRLKEENLLDIINNMGSLPTIKSSYKKIMNLIDQDGEINDVAKAIEEDYSIAIQLLHIANSAYFNVKTASIKNAVAYLGLNNIRELMLSTSIIDSLNTLNGNKNEIEKLWEYACSCNKMVKYIYEKILGKKVPESALTAGLLHDMGHIIIMTCYSKKYFEIRKSMAIHKTFIIDEEKKQFNITHQDIGGFLLNWWDMPFSIVQSALYHHCPFNDNVVDKELLCVINLAAHYISKKMSNRVEEPLAEGVLQYLKISSNCLEHIRSFA